eukprot:TRINITY_DN24893_c0_g2_i2.p1 TRINITY_DN24893_c0_g2~~TRINITY_DN24893_c0_g2_i2.p1  ORF type:complete len:658 (-),score=76.57 TRINITY_DN24893_c0_g2_i2:218-2191(-)
METPRKNESYQSSTSTTTFPSITSKTFDARDRALIEEMLGEYFAINAAECQNLYHQEFALTSAKLSQLVGKDKVGNTTPPSPKDSLNVANPSPDNTEGIVSTPESKASELPNKIEYTTPPKQHEGPQAYIYKQPTKEGTYVHSVFETASKNIGQGLEETKGGNVTPNIEKNKKEEDKTNEYMEHMKKTNDKKIEEELRSRECTIYYTRNLSAATYTNEDIEMDKWHAGVLRQLKSRSDDITTSKNKKYINLAAARLVFNFEGTNPVIVPLPNSSERYLKDRLLLLPDAFIPNVEYPTGVDPLFLDPILQRINRAKEVYRELDRYFQPVGAIGSKFTSIAFSISKDLVNWLLNPSDSELMMLISVKKHFYIGVHNYIDQYDLAKELGREKHLEEEFKALTACVFKRLPTKYSCQKLAMENVVNEVVNTCASGDLKEMEVKEKLARNLLNKYSEYFEVLKKENANASKISGFLTYISHTEQGIMNYLLSEEFWSRLVIPKETIGHKLFSVELDIATQYYPCFVCEASLIGFMNDTAKGSFLDKLKQKFNFPTFEHPHLIVRVGTNENTRSCKKFHVERDNHRRLKKFTVPSNWEKKVIFVKDYTVYGVTDVIKPKESTVYFANKSNIQMEQYHNKKEQQTKSSQKKDSSGKKKSPEKQS